MSEARNNNVGSRDNRQLGPYPDHLLKRVDSPTVAIPGPFKRRFRMEGAVDRVRKGEYGPEIAEKSGTFIFRYPLGPVISEVHSRLMSEPSPPAGGRELPKLDIPEDPAELSRNIKALAYFMGVDAVGICEIPSRSYFQDKDEVVREWQHAIVYLKRNDTSTTVATNGQDWIVDATAQRSYLHLTVAGETLASYIRQLGFTAESGNQRRNFVQVPPLIIEAGLAEACRIGIALNPFFGADFKAGVVLTDMPLVSDKPIDFGLQQYCDRCGICAKNCIGQAISHEKKQLYNGYEKYIFDADKCMCATANIENGTNCFVCIMNCPWTRQNSTPADFRNWDGSIEALTAGVDARAAELRANGFKRNSSAEESKWWLNPQSND